MNMTLYQAIEFVAAHGNDYAKAYARITLGNWHSASAEKFKTQIMYVSCNISHMRYDGSRNVRYVIHNFIHDNKTAVA